MTRPWGLAAGVAIVLGVWLGPVGFIALGLWMLMSYGLTGRFDARFAVVLAICIVAGALRGLDVETGTLPDGAIDSTGGRIEISGFARPNVDGDSVRATLVDVRGEAGSISGDDAMILVVLPPGVTVVSGETLLVTKWDLTPLENIAPSYARYLRGLGVTGRAVVADFEVIDRGPSLLHWFAGFRRDVSTRLMDAMPGDAGALAAGIVTGDDSALSRDSSDAFLNTGTSHITAVSGSNVAMVLAVWSVAFPLGRNRRRLLVQSAIVASIVAYAVFTGAEPPVTRAVIVAGVALFAGRFGRTPDIMTLLGLSAAVLALINPLNVHLASYWLSIVASVAIAIRMPISASAGAMRSYRGLLEGVVIAQVATVPLVLAWFGTWSPTSIFANVLLSPLMWTAFPLCFLLAMVTLVVPVLTPVFAFLPTLVLEISLRIVHVISEALPPVTVDAGGSAAFLAVTVPCLVIVALMANDCHRWWPTFETRRAERPLTINLTVVAPIVGIILGVLVAVALW